MAENGALNTCCCLYRALHHVHATTCTLDQILSHSINIHHVALILGVEMAENLALLITAPHVCAHTFLHFLTIAALISGGVMVENRALNTCYCLQPPTFAPTLCPHIPTLPHHGCLDLGGRDGGEPRPEHLLLTARRRTQPLHSVVHHLCGEYNKCMFSSMGHFMCWAFVCEQPCAQPLHRVVHHLHVKERINKCMSKPLKELVNH